MNSATSSIDAILGIGYLTDSSSLPFPTNQHSSIGCTEVCHLNADNHLRYNGVILSFGEKLSPYELFFGILSV